METDSEKMYQLCLKLRKLIEDNFEIVSVSDCLTSTPRLGPHKRASVVTKEGLIIEWVGNYFTTEESKEIKKDHIEGDIREYGNDDEDSDKEKKGGDSDEVLSTKTNVYS